MRDTRQIALEASKRVLEKLQDISRSLPRRPCLFGHRCMIRLWKRGAHSALPKSPFSPSAPARCGTELIPTSIQHDVARLEVYMRPICRANERRRQRAAVTLPTIDFCTWPRRRASIILRAPAQHDGSKSRKHVGAVSADYFLRAMAVDIIQLLVKMAANMAGRFHVTAKRQDVRPMP